MKCKVIELMGGLNDGGAETLVKDYALMIDKEKFDVKIVVIRLIKNTANYKILNDNNVEIIPVYPKWNVFVKICNKFFGKYIVSHRLKKILKSERPDALHAHLGLLHYLPPISDSLKDIRLFYTCHNEPWCFFRGENSRGQKAANFLIKNNNLQMIALHEDMAKELNRIFGIDNTVIVKNGIDFRKFKNVEEGKTEIRRSLNIPEDAFTVGHIGRFCEQKNQSYLLDIFKALHEKRPDSFLLMVGNGEMRDEIEGKIRDYGLSDKTCILSHRPDIPRILKAMDVFVFPSRFEGLGNVLLEAQLMNLRCIVSKTVPKAAFLTKFVIPLDINDTPEKWCDVILDESITGIPQGNLDDYDMNKEIKHLEELYSGR